MAFIQCSFYSESINIETHMNVILPRPTKDGSKAAYPTLYLLHGYIDDYTSWQRQSSIERYVYGLNLAVVMPDAQKSFYADFKDFERGYRYWEFIGDELLQITRGYFPLSHRREDTYVAGLSMGGYGAFKLAFNKPDTFGAAACLSGALHTAEIAKQHEFSKEFQTIFGGASGVNNSMNDMYYASSRLHTAAGPKPRLYHCCGTEDFLYSVNTGFRDHIKGLGSFDYTYAEGPGEHNWRYWDKAIQDVIAWLNPAPLN